ncbi:MAG: hypothetical protein LC753_05600 [Acidobacteria bacterium]|nr:hypothetical protein [Acidobacteriota bacterium]MCA1649765.1 hypothetical protein [Acidobacteriota bacterium]
MKRLLLWSSALLWLVPTACGGQASPTQPSAAAAPSASVVALEGEAGTGDGRIVERSRASGGRTIHLGPGERRRWTFAVGAAAAHYAVSVTYSNGKEGENEVISMRVDGVSLSSFLNRDSGDSTEGWNVFVTDPAGTSALRSGSHTIVLEVSGGDGCVEIDLVTLTPPAAGLVP